MHRQQEYLPGHETKNVHPGFSCSCVIINKLFSTVRVLKKKVILKQYWCIKSSFRQFHGTFKGALVSLIAI